MDGSFAQEGMSPQRVRVSRGTGVFSTARMSWVGATLYRGLNEDTAAPSMSRSMTPAWMVRGSAICTKRPHMPMEHTASGPGNPEGIAPQARTPFVILSHDLIQWP